MLMAGSSCAMCPTCGEAISLTTAAILQARERGVLCDCSLCRCRWVYRDHQDDRDAESRTEQSQPENSLPHFKHLKAGIPVEFGSTVLLVDTNPVVRQQLSGSIRSAGLNSQSVASDGGLLDRSGVGVTGKPEFPPQKT